MTITEAPRTLSIWAPPVAPERVSTTVSPPSGVASSAIGTAKVLFEPSPGSQVRVPEVVV